MFNQYIYHHIYLSFTLGQPLSPLYTALWSISTHCPFTLHPINHTRVITCVHSSNRFPQVLSMKRILALKCSVALVDSLYFRCIVLCLSIYRSVVNLFILAQSIYRELIISRGIFSPQTQRRHPIVRLWAWGIWCFFQSSYIERHCSLNMFISCSMTC